MDRLDNPAANALRREVFASGADGIFMVIDGASVPALLDRLYDHQPVYSCLLTGPLEPDMREVAPYLVELREGEGFTDWVLDDGFGHHWGIILRSRLSHQDARRRFRRLLFVRSAEDGASLFFRFYDPRVLRVYLPSCADSDLPPWFDDVDCYLIEGEIPGTLLRAFAANDERILVEEIVLDR